MNDKRLRDLFWLAVLALVLAAWGWDRGRLATRIEMLNTPSPSIPSTGVNPMLAPWGGSLGGGWFSAR